MNLDFHSISEKKAGRKWKKLFDRHWPAYRSWYVGKRHDRSPNLKTSQARLKKYMPEFYPMYLKLCELAGPDTVAHRFLTGYSPPPYISGCAQIVNEKEAQLVRNYDFNPRLSEGTLLRSAWHDRTVIAMGDSLIGVLDGMNSSGLVVSLTFGGRKVVGDGFGMPFILRYVLEFCTSINEAEAALRRIPSHMSYNIMLMNRKGEHRLMQVAPDHPAVVTDLSASTNHQGKVDWPKQAAFTKTIERELYLHDMLNQGGKTGEEIADEFLKAPLFNRKYRLGFGTIYTAVYKPKQGAIELRWPGLKLRQTFKEFQEGFTSIIYSEAVPRSTTPAILDAQLQLDYDAAVEAYWVKYGRSWANKEHSAMTEYLDSSQEKPMKTISQRIKELLADMEEMTENGSDQPKQENPQAWTQVSKK